MRCGVQHHYSVYVLNCAIREGYTQTAVFLKRFNLRLRLAGSSIGAGGMVPRNAVSLSSAQAVVRLVDDAMKRFSLQIFS
jgi:hypothetical protein